MSAKFWLCQHLGPSLDLLHAGQVSRPLHTMDAGVNIPKICSPFMRIWYGDIRWTHQRIWYFLALEGTRVMYVRVCQESDDRCSYLKLRFWKLGFVFLPNMTQYNKRYILSTFENIEIFALSNRRFNKFSNDIKLVKIILLKIQVLQGMNFLLFSLYFTHCFAHYLRINLSDNMSLLLYWVTNALK